MRIKKADGKKGTGLGASVVAGKHLYERSVASRAFKRGGMNKNLKGHVFEIMTADKINASPSNFLNGRKAVLTKSTTAVRDDIVVKQGGKVVERMQLKDTPGSIKDTLARVKNQQYKGTKLVGTKETAKAYERAVAKSKGSGVKITQKMTTNGISSGQTELIATRKLGGNIVKNSGKIVNQASKVGVKTAVVSTGVGVAVNTGQVLKGEKSISKAAVDVTKDAAINGVVASVGDYVATATTMVIACTPAASIAGPAGIATGVATSIATESILRNLDYDASKKRTENRNNNRYVKMVGS